MPPLIYSFLILVLIAVAVAILIGPGFGALVLVVGAICLLVLYAPRGPNPRV